MRKGVVFGLVALLLAAAGGWYFASPGWTLHQMAAAAKARNGERLSAYIDFPKLRETTKAQLKAQVAAKLTSGTSNGFEALGAMIGMSMVDAMVDGMLTPQGMTAMFASERAKPTTGTKPPAKPFGIDAANREVVREGLNRFRLHDKSAKGRDGDLIFERHGLGWKLAEITVPQNLMDSPGKTEEPVETSEEDAG